MADEDRYLTGGGEFDPERGSGSYNTNTSFGPFSGGAILTGQDEAVPTVGGRFTTQLPANLSATLSHMAPVGKTAAHANNAVRLATKVAENELALSANRMGEHGVPSYGLQYSGQIGKQGGAKPYYPPPSGNWYVDAGGTSGTPERHLMLGAKGRFADGGHVDAALHLLRQHFDEGGFLDSLRGLFSGPEVLSTGDKLVDDGRVNWGNPELASDFFRADKADKALRLAREVQDDVTGSTPKQAPLTAPRPGPVEERELPVNIPLNAPERGVPVLGASVAPASFATQPLAYSPEPPKNPARAAIDEATKISARAPQGPDLTDRDRDLIIRTIAAETSGKTPEESQAIAHVILNRIASGKYGATPEAVLFARKQFEPWSNPNGANYPMRFLPESRRYGLGQTALDAALANEDITKGATNFWAPKAQAALGRRPPKWGRTGGVDIGETRFHKLERAEGGIVDDALHVVREHHADGEAVGQAPVATDNPDRVRAAEDAANLAKQIQAYEASMASIRQQPQDIQSMTHAPEKPRAPISVEALGKNREFGSTPYDVAGPLSTLAQGAYDMKTMPLYAAGMAFPPAAALGTAIDTAEGVASGSPTQVAMGALGGPLKVARNVIAPLAVATGVGAPDEAEAARLPRIGGVASALSKVAPKAADASLEQALNVVRQAAPQRELSPMGFYSHGAETAADLQQAKGTPEQMVANLRRSAVKPEELYHSGIADETATLAKRTMIESEYAPKVEAAKQAMEGLVPGTPEFTAAERQFKNISSSMRSEMDNAMVLHPDWASRPSVTREEIAQHFQQRMPQVEETVLGGKSHVEFTPEMQQRLNDLTDKRVSGGLTESEMAEKNQLYNLEQEARSGRSKTKFGQYSLPGGENYREVLLKMPEGYGAPKQALDDLAAARQRFKDLEKRHTDELHAGLTGDMNMSYEDFDKLTRERDIAAARVKNFEKLANQPVFQSGHWQDPNVLAHLRMADRTGPNGEKILHVEEIQSDWGQKGKKEGFVTQYKPEDIKPMDPANITSERRRNEFWNFETPTGAIDVPRNDRWPTMEAARQHILDNVKPTGVPSAPYVTNTQAWTDLALKRALREAAEGGYDKLVWTPGAEQAKRYPDGGIKREEGMKGYYDKIVPNQLSKLVKKLDPEAKVGVHDLITKKGGKVADEAALNENSQLIEQGRFWDDARAENVSGYRVTSPGGQELGVFENLPDAHDALLQVLGSAKEPDTILKVPSLTITPKMRESILKGQSAHARGGEVVDHALHAVRRHFAGDEGSYVDPMGSVAIPAAGAPSDVAPSDEPSLVDRAMSFVSQFNPVGSAEAASLFPKVPKIKAPEFVPRQMTLQEVRRTFDPHAGAGMSGEDLDRLANAYGKVASPASLDPELARRGEEIAKGYITKGGSESGGRSFFGHKPSVPLEELGRATASIPVSSELKPVVNKTWGQVAQERAGSPLITLGGDLSDWNRILGYGPEGNLSALARPTDIHAGFDYMREPNPYTVWANNPEHAAMLNKQVQQQKDIMQAVKKDLPVMAVAAPMGPQSIDSSKNMMDLVLSAIEGKGIHPTHLEEASDYLRSGAFGKTPEAKAAYKAKMADFPGFNDTEGAREFLLNNPEIAGTIRGDIVKGLEKSTLVKKGFPEIGQLRYAASSPQFAMAPANMMGGRMVEIDPRLFGLAQKDKMFNHFTYPGDTFGKYYADVPLIHRQYGAPDVMDTLMAKYNQWRPGATKSAPPKAPITVHPFSTDQGGRDTVRKMFEEQRMVQPINPRMLESIMRGEQRRPLYGFAKGGSVEDRALSIVRQ